MQQPDRPIEPLKPGDITPRLSLTGPRGEVVDTGAPPMAGRINLMVLGGTDTRATSAMLAALADRRGQLEGLGGRGFLVTRPSSVGRPTGAAPGLPGLGAAQLPGLGAGSPGHVPGRTADIGELKAGAMRLVDHTGDVFHLAGAEGDDVVLLVIGPNLHVIDIIRAARPPESIAKVLDELDRRASGQGLNSPAPHPPVLAVPDVFSPADSAHLMSIFNTRGQEFVEPGHLALGNRTTDCKMRIPDLGRRDRIDHWVVESDTQALITDRLRRRLFPEIQKAFNYQVTRHERYRLARYEGERGGEQMGHRDNTDPTVAHRRFAVTINLNAEDYEGAELRFPEYSDQLYKPASGTAIVFSCSLLHEVVGMRSGSRFAMLAFLFGDH
jgi:hypothetical protein